MEITFPGAAEKCDAHVHGQLLANEKATCMADQQVHRVIYCPPAGVFDRNNPQRIARSENSIEDRFDSGTRRQDRALSEPLASKNMRERPFGTKIVYRISQQPSEATTNRLASELRLRASRARNILVMDRPQLITSLCLLTSTKRFQPRRARPRSGMNSNKVSKTLPLRNTLRPEKPIKRVVTGGIGVLTSSSGGHAHAHRPSCGCGAGGCHG